MPSLYLSPLVTLLGQIVLIVVVSRLLAIVLGRLGQPLVMAEVIAGIVLGPSLFGWLWPDAMAYVFPTPSFSLLRMLSQVGLVLYMFLVGLELDSNLLRGRARSSIVISHTSIVFPFALGAAAALWLHETYSSPNVPMTTFALFLGISMSVTAFPVLARILSERNLMASRVGAIAIACAAIDDVSAWCLLAFVIGITRADAFTASLWTIGLALGFIALMTLAVRPLLNRVATRMTVHERLTTNVVAIILLSLCTSSAITELIGIHSLFGAFLFGAIMPKHGRLAEILIEKLETVSVVLLLPLFFAFSGLRTEIGLLDNAQAWLVTSALIVVASVGKFGGSSIAARITGIRWREASAIGILMNTRGLMELIVLNIGRDLGVISPIMFTMLVIMALVTTFATTPILRRVYPTSEFVQRPSTLRLGGLPAAAPFRLLMCVADDSSGLGLATVASGLLGQESDSRLLVLHMTVPTDRPSVARRRRETSEQVGPMPSTLARARALKHDVQIIDFVSADPGVDICNTADARRASLILLGAHRPLLFGWHLGGTVKKVVGHAKQTVAVLFDRGVTELQRVLVAYNGPEDLATVRVGARFGSSAQVTVLRADKTAKHAPALTDANLRDAAAAPGIEIRTVDPHVDFTTEAGGYDLVVIGMRGDFLGKERQADLASSVLYVYAAGDDSNARSDA